MPNDGQVWINTTDFTTLQLILFGLGSLGWVIAYAGVLRMVRRAKFVEIPAAAVAGNIAWEFVWSFVFVTNMGSLFVWGYRIWFFLDIVIVTALLLYGSKQVVTPALKRHFRPAVAFGIIAWLALLYFFVKGGFDTSTGATTGYILNVMMSALYIVLILGHDVKNFSLLVAWSKMLGTVSISVFSFATWPDNGFLLTLCVVTFILDAIYISVFYARASTAAEGT